MAKPVMLAALISAGLFCSFVGETSADIILTDIKSSKDCAAFLKVTSKQTKQGLIEFVVRIQPEEATHAKDLYHDRVRSEGRLQISSADLILAAMMVHKALDRDVAEFRFELAPQVAKYSVFTISASLFEKNGRPTFGGGKTFRIHLDGFLPGNSPR